MYEELIDLEKFESVLGSLKSETVSIKFYTNDTFYTPAVIMKDFTFVRSGNLYTFGEYEDDDEFSINSRKYVAINLTDLIPQISGLILRVDFYGGNYVVIKQESGY